MPKPQPYQPSVRLQRPLLLASLTLLLASCAWSGLDSSPPSEPSPAQPAPSQPTAPARTLGLYELTMNGGDQPSGSGLESNIQALGAELSGLSYKLDTHSTLADFKTGILHLTANYIVTNNSGADIMLPTFIPVDTEGQYATDGETPFRNVVTRKGVPISGEHIIIQRAHHLNNGVVEENPSATPLLGNLDTAGLQLQIPANTKVAGISRQGWQGSKLAAGASQIISFAMRVKLQGRDVSDNDPFRFSLVFAAVDSPARLPASFKGIHEVQGDTPNGDAATPLAGQSVSIEGVVTADQRSGNLQGFWVQEAGINADKNPSSSEGIFVYCGSTCSGIGRFAVGDRVRVTGTAGEFAVTTVTQITNPSVSLISSGVPLPQPQAISLPLDTKLRERLEGMRVEATGVVTNNFPLGRGGSFDIANMRIPTFTQVNAPDASAFAAYKTQVSNMSLRIDDFSRQQNPPAPFGRNQQPLSASNTLRGGDTAKVTGVLHHGNDGWNGGGSLDTYRLHASQIDTVVQPSNARPSAPAAVGGTLKVGAMNVLNYFNTMSKTAGSCSPFAASSNARGAENCTEFVRQQAKIVSAIQGLDADVLGLMEIENNFAQGSNSAAAFLVAALNAKAGAGTYAYIDPKQNVGSDAISVALIYKPSKVQPTGRLAILGDAFDAKYTESCNRPTLAQSFQEKASGEQFTAAVVHFKSKGSACAALGDNDQNDGQGNAYRARENAASVLSTWLKTNPTGIADNDYVVLGDFNAYAKEKVLDILAQNGLSNVFGPESYSYQFDGQWGSLDHAVASASLLPQITGKAKWAINADEPAVLDYNTNFKSPEQISSFYDESAFRSSDHDPLLIGLSLRP